MKFKECSYEEQLERALLIIDGICLENMDEDTEIINLIYTVAHAAHQHCGNKHEDWIEEIEKLQIALKEANILDIEREMNYEKL